MVFQARSSQIPVTDKCEEEHMRTVAERNLNNSTSSLKRDILPILAARVANAIEEAIIYGLEPLEEVRLRSGRPLVLQNYYKEWFIGRNSMLSAKP